MAATLQVKEDDWWRQSKRSGRSSIDDCSVEDVLYHLYVLQAVERGQADVAAGRVISHEEVESAMRRKWLRGADG